LHRYKLAKFGQAEPPAVPVSIAPDAIGLFALSFAAIEVAYEPI
jgi:hypothetical protein